VLEVPEVIFWLCGNRLVIVVVLRYEPRSFLNFGAQVGKVIFFTKFTWKLHLPLFFLSLAKIIIKFIIIVVILDFIIIIFLPTLVIIITTFLFP